MPELPEAEASRRLLETHCVGQTIVQCVVKEQGGGSRDGQFDEIVIDEGETGTTLQTKLLARKIQNVCRKGKQLWINFEDKGPSLLFHHGMTGTLRVRGVESVSYKSVATDVSWPPKFCKIMLKFSNQCLLAFTDPRRLGRVRLRQDPLMTSPIKDLAPDPVVDTIDDSRFKSLLQKTSTSIKAALLDQQRLVCGIGNWLADDILLAAHIHPETKCNELTDAQSTKLASAIPNVCKLACAVNADSNLFPKEWLFHMRWNAPRGQSTLDDGRIVLQSTVAGRSTIHIPSIQKKSGKVTSKKNNPASKSKTKLGDTNNNDNNDDSGDICKRAKSENSAIKKKNPKSVNVKTVKRRISEQPTSNVAKNGKKLKRSKSGLNQQ
eukprot:m.93296 g.93296  ORF g.93296 m.93296 type:complete len:379 (-) comp26624_c0_seq2:282-1418(-)